MKSGYKPGTTINPQGKPSQSLKNSPYVGSGKKSGGGKVAYYPGCGINKGK